MKTNISAGHVTTVLKAAGFTKASWNRNTERVNSAGFISTLETWCDTYVSVHFAQQGWYSKPTQEEFDAINDEVQAMAQALNAAGYDAKVSESVFGGTNFIQVRKAA